MGLCCCNAKKEGNIKQRRREQTRKNTCWPNAEAPYAQLWPDCWLASLHAHSLPGLITHADADMHTCNTRFTGDKPAKVILAYFSARVYQSSIHTFYLYREEEEGGEGGRRVEGCD